MGGLTDRAKPTLFPVDAGSTILSVYARSDHEKERHFVTRCQIWIKRSGKPRKMPKMKVFDDPKSGLIIA
jgi:hypothetical protein